MPSLEQIASLIESCGPGLTAEADAARRDLCGDAVHLRGIIEFSNVCSRNCAYCGLRRGNTALPRYTMSGGQIIHIVADAEAMGVRTIVLQSGESDACNAEALANVIAAVKRRFDVAITLSVGVKPVELYRLWREAGADRFLLKFEAANPQLYGKFNTHTNVEDRLAALEALRDLGYQTGSGYMIGLPGQTVLDLAADIALARDLDLDMAAFGPFVPHPATPLGAEPPGDLDLALRVVAVARHVLGPVHIPATTAFDAIAPDGRERALRAGANVIMPNLTPLDVRGLYQIYPSDRTKNSIDNVKALLHRIGRPLATDQGHSLKRGPSPSEILWRGSYV